MLPSIHIRWPEDSDDTDRPRTNASRSLTITFKEVETIFFAVVDRQNMKS